MKAWAYARVRVVTPLLLALLTAAVLAAPAVAGTSYPPIAPGPATVLPDFAGAAATPQPVDAPIAQNPSLAPNPFSHLHNDSCNSDVFSVWAPLGSAPKVFSSTLGASVSGGTQMTTFMATDTDGRLVAVEIDSSGSYLLLIDPGSLEVLCSRKLGEGGTKAIAENNYGYAWSFAPNGEMSSTPGLPGLERVDVRGDGD
jgi:hypothetical protein